MSCPVVHDELNRALGFEGLLGEFAVDEHGILIRSERPPGVPGGTVTPPATRASSDERAEEVVVVLADDGRLRGGRDTQHGFGELTHGGPPAE